MTIETSTHMFFVFGGRVKDPQGVRFEDLSQLHYVGMFRTYDEAEKCWRGASQAMVDDAKYKYVIVPMHQLLEPEEND